MELDEKIAADLQKRLRRVEGQIRGIQAMIVEVPQDDGPWGARGVGEHSMVPTTPAIANAIYDAVGVRLEGPPFTAEKVYLKMLEAGVVK